VSALLGDYIVEPVLDVARITVADDVKFDDIVIDASAASGHQGNVVGVDYQRLHAALGKAIGGSLLTLSGHAAGQCRAAITRLMQRAQSLDDSLRLHEDDLLNLKTQLRTEFA
jgi:hypothetical protein